MAPGSTVFAFGLAAEHLPLVRGVRYVGHNLTDVQSDKILSSGGNLTHIQVWTNKVVAPGVSPNLACVAFDARNKTLYQPWGTPFPESSWHAEAAVRRSSSEFWIGSIWSNSAGQGNRTMLESWKNVLSSKGVTFRKVLPGWPDRPGAYAALIRRSRLGASIVGDWQCANEYLPCRVFKNTSVGVAPAGNNLAYSRIFGDSAVVESDLDTLADRLLTETWADHQERLREAQKRTRPYTYEIGLERILDLSREPRS